MGGRIARRKCGSNHSDLIRLLAPGTDIKSAVPGNKYALQTGTSMAAPHVAGAFAVLRQAKPTATVDELVEALRCSGKPINRLFVRALAPAPASLQFEPYRRRIDLLGAFYAIKNVPNALRTWSFDKVAEGSDWAPRVRQLEGAIGELCADDFRSRTGSPLRCRPATRRYRSLLA